MILKDLADVGATCRDPMTLIPARPDKIRNAGFMEALPGAMHVFFGAWNVENIEIQDVFRTNMTGNGGHGIRNQ
jgi:hypothetical protein